MLNHYLIHAYHMKFQFVSITFALHFGLDHHLCTRMPKHTQTEV